MITWVLSSDILTLFLNLADIYIVCQKTCAAANHRLRGSASPVLTATHHSYGSPRLSDFFPAHLWRSDPQPILTQNGSNDVDSRKDVHFAAKSQLFIPPDLQGP